MTLDGFSGLAREVCEDRSVDIYEPRWREPALLLLRLLGLESGARLWPRRRPPT